MLRNAALLIVDVQLDFCPGGALAVPQGETVIPVLNEYIKIFSHRRCPIIASRDWHPENATHFTEYGGTWPRHCLQGSRGAQFHPDLQLPPKSIVISKGITPWDDGYSAMQGISPDGTLLPMLLRRLDTNRLYVGGLATDYCVKESVLGALQQGFIVFLLSDAIRGVDLHPGDTEKAIQEMVAEGAQPVTLESVTKSLAEE